MTAAEHKYLLFTLYGRRYAFDLAQVAEVQEPPLTWPIPGAPPCYCGAMNFHGSIVAVMDLAAFLGFPDVHGPEKVVVLDPDLAALAFLVERVDRIVSADQVQLGDQVRPANEWLSAATLVLADGAADLLDAAVIVEKAGESLLMREGIAGD